MVIHLLKSDSDGDQKLCGIVEMYSEMVLVHLEFWIKCAQDFEEKKWEAKAANQWINSNGSHIFHRPAPIMACNTRTVNCTCAVCAPCRIFRDLISREASLWCVIVSANNFELTPIVVALMSPVSSCKNLPEPIQNRFRRVTLAFWVQRNTYVNDKTTPEFPLSSCEKILRSVLKAIWLVEWPNVRAYRVKRKKFAFSSQNSVLLKNHSESKSIFEKSQSVGPRFRCW